jgi:hypothetical protein
MKRECVYAVAVASDACQDEDGTIIQIPVSVHCSEGDQQQFSTVSQSDAQEQCGDTQAQHCVEVRTVSAVKSHPFMVF